MNQDWLTLLISFVQTITIVVDTHQPSLYKLKQITQRHALPLHTSPVPCQNCLVNNILNALPNNRIQVVSGENLHKEIPTSELMASPSFPSSPSLYRPLYMQHQFPGRWHPNSNPLPHPGYSNRPILNQYQTLGMSHHYQDIKNTEPQSQSHAHLKGTGYTAHKRPRAKVSVPASTWPSADSMKSALIEQFLYHLDKFDQKFYKTTFSLLTSVSQVERQENGISFVQSGFFLMLTLMALSPELDSTARAEVEQCIGLKLSEVVTTDLIKYLVASLPVSSDRLKFQSSTRLMVWPGHSAERAVRSASAAALRVIVEKFEGTETPELITQILNKKIEMDSGGSMHDTFEYSDIPGGVSAVLVNMMYLRGQWRANPTLLNGTHAFYDNHKSPPTTVRMIRINDLMKYAHILEWDAEALEIQYATPGLSLLMLVPRTSSLRTLTRRVANTSVALITQRMRTVRVAATLPLYTLRMTLLLPNKLQAMGISRLVDVRDSKSKSLRLSHSLQRLMFWADAGRNAFKDDGIEWDETPQLKMFVDRPYIFFVRWKNITLMNGNFVL